MRGNTSMPDNCRRRAILAITILIGSMLFWLAACSRPPAGTRTPGALGTQTPAVATAMPAATAGESIQLRWLDKIPCAAPCWEGITPGQTTAEEAIRILSKQPYLEQVQFDGGYTVSWRWAGEDWKSYANYDKDTPGRPISAIRPGFTYWFSLADVIQAYGEPTHVAANAYHSGGETFYVLEYVCLPQGIWLIYPSRGEYKPPLKASSRFGEVTFFSPSEAGLVAAGSGSTEILKLLKPWEGFRDFDYYCVDYPAFIPCK